MKNSKIRERITRPREELIKKNNIVSFPIIISILIVLALGLASLMIGAYDIQANPGGSRMFYITRIPRTSALMLTGAAMSVGGLVMQILTQNKFVEPTTTGTIEWAGLGLVLVYLIIPSPSLIQRMGGAIAFSFIGTMVFFIVLKKLRLKSSLVVPIIGMMIGSVISAISTLVGLIFDMTQTLETWFIGSFAQVQVGRYEYLWVVLLITLAIYLYADRLTLAGLGEDVAINLGLNYGRILLLATAFVSLGVGVVAAVVGNVPFIGLIVPNLVSIFRGDDLRSNLPWVAIIGMGILTLCDILSRIIIPPFEIPVSTILGSLGAGVFILILIRQRRSTYGR